MKNKYTLIKYLGITGLIFIVLLYMLLYFMPTLEAINGLKRQVKDQSRMIDEFRRAAASFVYPDEPERELLKQTDQDIRARFTAVHNREEFIALFTRVLSELESRARTDGVSDLVITSLAPDLQVNAAPLSSGKSVQDELLAFFGTRLGELQGRKPETGPASPAVGPAKKNPFLDLNHLEFQDVYLSVSGALPALMNYLNRLPRCRVPLDVERCWIGAGGSAPLAVLVVRVYFLDLRSADA